MTQKMKYKAANILV